MDKNNLSRFVFILKSAGALTEKDKNEMYALRIKMYPKFKKYYDRNRYYSTVKPQKVFLVRDKESGKLVGTSKLLWRKVTVGDETIRFFARGMLVDTAYQRLGIGTEIVRRSLVAMKKLHGDLLCGTTDNPIAMKILRRLGFKKLKCPIYYTEVDTGKKKKSELTSFAFATKKGLIDKINRLPEFYIGTGPV